MQKTNADAGGISAGTIAPDEFTPPPLPCANCGALLSGPYCSVCGQHVADFHRSIWRFIAEFFDSTLCWDNKLFATLGPLFRQPGLLTLEFMAGRRVRYVNPLRLFLFTSAVCLTLLQFSFDHQKPSRRRHGRAAAKQDGFQWVISDTPKPGASPTASPGASPAASPGKPEDMEDRIGKAVEAKIAKNGGQAQTNKAISENIRQRLSWIALALLPVFALILRAAYWRQDSFYFSHLVFSLHYHTFLLFFWTAYTGAGLLAAFMPFSSLLGSVLKLSLLLPPCYLFVALRRMYGEGPKRTFVKALLIGSVHLLTIFICLVIFAAAFFSS